MKMYMKKKNHFILTFTLYNTYFIYILCIVYYFYNVCS